jgi:hypothetical protein
MNRFLSGVIGAALGVASAVPVAAQTTPATNNTGYGTTSAEFLLLGAGARGAALGGSFAAITTDVEALYWNAGGLAQLERPSIAFGTYSYVANTRYSWAGLAFPMGGGSRAIGIHGGTFGFSNQPIYTLEDPEGTSGQTYSVRESYLGLTYSQNFSDRFSAGMTGKFISDRLGLTSGTGFAVDFGTSFHAMIGPRPIRASFVIQNLGTTIRQDGRGLDATATRPPPTGQVDLPQEPQPARYQTKDFGLPVTFRVALAYDFIHMAAGRLTALGEFTQPNNSNATANGGLEGTLLNVAGTGLSLTARGSYTYQGDNNLNASCATAGFGCSASGTDFSTSVTSKEWQDGLALGGGIGFLARSGFGLSVDYAWRSLGLLGGTNFFSATLHW